MQHTPQTIRNRKIHLGLCALVLLGLCAPTFGDELFYAGWLTGVLNGWGQKKVSANAGGGSSVVWRNERVYVRCYSLFADESHFHNAACEFSMEVKEGSRLLQKSSWGYQTGTWETKTRRSTRTMSFPVSRLSPGRHVLDLIIKVRLNGKTKTDTGTIVLTVK